MQVYTSTTSFNWPAATLKKYGADKLYATASELHEDPNRIIRMAAAAIPSILAAFLVKAEKTGPAAELLGIAMIPCNGMICIKPYELLSFIMDKTLDKVNQEISGYAGMNTVSGIYVMEQVAATALFLLQQELAGQQMNTIAFRQWLAAQREKIHAAFPETLLQVPVILGFLPAIPAAVESAFENIPEKKYGWRPGIHLKKTMAGLSIMLLLFMVVYLLRHYPRGLQPSTSQHYHARRQ